MPDGGIQITLILADDTHTDLRDKVIRENGQDALQNVSRLAVSLAFQVSLSQEAIGIDVFGVAL